MSKFLAKKYHRQESEREGERERERERKEEKERERERILFIVNIITMIYIHIYEFAIRMRAGVYKLMNNCLDRRVLVVPLPSRFRASRHHPRSILIFTTTIKKIELETKKTFVESCVAFDPSKSAANSKASRGERERGREIS